jgi:hypothetical protein
MPTKQQIITAGLKSSKIYNLVYAAGCLRLAADGNPVDGDAAGPLDPFVHGLLLAGALRKGADLSLFCARALLGLERAIERLRTCPKCGGKDLFEGRCSKCNLEPIGPGSLDLIPVLITHEKENGRPE